MSRIRLATRSERNEEGWTARTSRTAIYGSLLPPVPPPTPPAPPSVLLLQKVPVAVQPTVSTLQTLLPGLDVRVVEVPTSAPSSLAAQAIDAYVAETGRREIVLNLNSQQMTDYGLSLVSARPSLTFLNLTSTIPAVRAAAPANLYFGLESDDFFLPALWQRTQGPASVRYLLIQAEPDVFVQTVAGSALDAGLPVIGASDVAALAEELAGATTIFICALTEAAQQQITAAIPEAFVGNLVFIDAGPFSQQILENVATARVVFTQSQSTPLAHLPATHPWTLATKSSFSNTAPPNVLGLYSVLKYAGSWRPLLLDPLIVIRGAYAVNCIINQVNTLPI